MRSVNEINFGSEMSAGQENVARRFDILLGKFEGSNQPSDCFSLHNSRIKRIDVLSIKEPARDKRRSWK